MSGMKRTLGIVAVMTACSVVQVAEPAQAGGFAINVTPKGQDAEAVRTGLALYSIARNLSKKNRARVEQNGSGNGAAVSQHGDNNWAGIYQRGRDNSGTISQNGDNNAFALFQFGKKRNTQVTQNGDGNVGLRFEGGW